MNYFDELKNAMNWLASQENTIFMGQAVGCAGTSMSSTLKEVPPEKKLELPVFEETQLGMSLGMSLTGIVPVSIFPRWNFLLCAMSQLVNHVDKFPEMFGSGKVIIRTGIGSVVPLDPNVQHKGDYTDAVRQMLTTVKVVRLEKPEDIVPAYQEAYFSKTSTILVEVSDFLNEEYRLSPGATWYK